MPIADWASLSRGPGAGRFAAAAVGRAGAARAVVGFFLFEAAAEEVKDHGLVLGEAGLGEGFAGLALEGVEHRAFEVSIKDSRVDVALAADGGGVAEALRHRLDGADQVAAGLGAGIGGRELLEGKGRQDRAGPGAEVLRREVVPADLAEVVVDIGRVDRLAVAFVVDVLEELLAGNVAAFLDDPGEAPVLEGDEVLLAALALEAELDLRAIDIDVAVAHGGEAE